MSKQLDHIDSSKFEFVQVDKKIYDKKFETKPIGYFKDAMIRFGKNKTNVFATVILFLIIGMSIFVPVLSTKNSDALEERLAFLPPRVPILENWGILDGTIKRVDQVVDLTTIDPETGVGRPSGVPIEYIVMETLKNYTVPCSIREAACTGGQAVLRLDASSNRVSVVSGSFLQFSKPFESILKINIFEFVERDPEEDVTVLNVYITSTFGGEYELIGTFDTAGIHEIDVFELYPAAFFITTKIKLELQSTNSRNIVAIESVEVYNNNQATPVFSNSGFPLAQYTIDSTDGGAGRYVRQNGTILMSSYRYRAYDAAFGPRTNIAFPESRYLAILAQYPDVCVQSPDPENPLGWTFEEGCPIIKVNQKNSGIRVGNEWFYSYNLVYSYGLMEYPELMEGGQIPYFFFGTSAAGKDLFKLIWIAMRTSLLVGVIVSFINISFGIIYGAISGYYGGTVDLLMERFTEIVGRIPWLVTLSIAVALLSGVQGAGIYVLIIVLVISGWIGIAGITRTQFYRYKGREYVLASRTLGASDGRLIFRHILPNAIGTIITASILSIPYVIFSESTISYLGFGIGHGTNFNIFGVSFSGVSLGVLLADGRDKLLNYPYLTIFPAVLISILMITFNMFGNALRDAFNPALRGAE
jgi:ABC-type dipeptide/oligopeptide/nickel transport system permease subunit